MDGVTGELPIEQQIANEGLDLNLSGLDPISAVARAVETIYVKGRETMSQKNRDEADALAIRIATDAYNDIDEAKKFIQAAIRKALEPKP